jgi:hypothetical protein
MTTFDVAHLRQQGQDLIIVLVKPDFGSKTSTEQEQIRLQLEIAANRAGLAGHAVTVWDAGSGRMGFRGPSAWKSFLEGLSLPFVAANINKRITVS